MDILVPTTHFVDSQTSPESPTLYTRKSSRVGTDGNPEHQDDPPVLSQKTPAERTSRGRLKIGFLPLTPIIGSPICTPTSTISSQDEDYQTLESSQRVSLRLLVSTNGAPGTWVSTPPTPPTKSARHCSNLLSHSAKAPNTMFSPSASFPASMQPHARHGPRQRPKKFVSAPSMKGRRRAVSEPPQLGPFQLLPPGLSRLRSLSQSMAHDVGQDNDNIPTRSKPLFHFFNPSTDNEDDEYRPRSLNDDTSPDGSSSDHCPEDVWENDEQQKDAIRRYHALKELLSTELGYLMDLKAFVTIYLRNLPTLAQRAPAFNSTFGRASSFASTPWATSYTPLHAHAHPPATLSEAQPPQLSSPIKDLPKSSTRYLFSDSELEMIIRNGEEILQLHERFADGLSTIGAHYGISMDHLDSPPPPKVLYNLNAAIRTVSAKFAIEASRFNAYQSFCAGHLEALDLVRKISHQYPSEWETFEQRCSVMVSDFENGKAAESEPKSQTEHHSLGGEDRMRALSLTSIDSAVRSLRLRCPTTREGAGISETKREVLPSRRIAFVDYMIKPIQRICKYPLLLDQLLRSKPSQFDFQRARSGSSDVDVVVESASQAMRRVASSVDEARHRHDAAMQSSLVASRMFFGSQMLMAASEPSIQILTTEFLASLGSCTLAGALDVMQHHPLRPLESISNFKAKYLGAFLYPGGYLILVKVFKGKKYEPKHWFPLADFMTSDVEEDEAMLPYSIRLSCREQHFELAASCQKEKDVWLSAIRDSLTVTPEWVNEPTPSFRFDEKGELISSLSSEHDIPHLPTIQSIPELSKNASDTELSEPFFASLRGPTAKNKMKMRRYEHPIKQEGSPSNSRRSSTTSVKSIFGPMTSDPETIVIRRSSLVARMHVDQALQDVTSPACLDARMYAYSHDEELFRSTSSVGGTRSKSRLSKHESIRVPRSRTAESLDTLLTKSPSPKTTIASRRNTAKLRITPIPSKSEDDRSFPTPSSSGEGIPTPSSSSQSHDPPSLTHADTSSSSSGLFTPPITSTSEGIIPLRSSKSLVRGVKDLFHFRPMSGTFHLTSGHEPGSHYGSSTLQRWTIDSIRRRPRSVPEALSENGPEFNHPVGSASMAIA